MKRIIAALTALTATVMLAGCFLPESFDASLKLNQDGSYSYKYEGITAFVPVVMDMKSSGKSPDSVTDQKMKVEAEKLAKKPDVKKSKYVGNGRFDFEIAGDRKAGQAANVLDAFRVFTDKQGVINITAANVQPQEKAELAKLGLKMNGKLEVTLPQNAEVISSNATSSPKLFGLFGTYSWKIGSIDERPMMKVRLKN